MTRMAIRISALAAAALLFTGCTLKVVSGVGETTAGQGGSGPTAGGGQAFVGAYWTGSAEAVDRIDPATGAGTFVGNLGSLHWWTSQLVLDGDATHVYATGTDVSNVTKLFVLDLQTGTSTEATLVSPDYVLAGVAEDGRAIGVRWNGAAEEVDLIDPGTGVATTAGTLGDLQTWTSQATYDHAAHVVYALGTSSSSPNDLHLYSLALDTHVSGGAPCSVDFVLGGVTAGGTLVGAYWDGTVEQVGEVDPATCTVTPRGHLGDLHWWTSQLTYDRVTHVAHATGTTVDESMARLYTLNTDTQASSETTPAVTTYVLARP